MYDFLLLRGMESLVAAFSGVVNSEWARFRLSLVGVGKLSAHLSDNSLNLSQSALGKFHRGMGRLLTNGKIGGVNMREGRC